jgi:hypothetical protein
VKKKSGCPLNSIEEVHELLDLPIKSEGTSSALAAKANSDPMQQLCPQADENNARVRVMPASKWSRRLLTGKIKHITQDALGEGTL